MFIVLFVFLIDKTSAFTSTYTTQPSASGKEPAKTTYGGYGSSNENAKYENVEVRPPGPWQEPTPNYKCEKSHITLYVSKLRWHVDHKCFTIFEMECHTELKDGMAIEMKKSCNDFTETKCRTVYETKFEQKCRKVYKKKCERQYETVEDTRYERNCTTVYVNQCTKRSYDAGYGGYGSGHRVKRDNRNWKGGYAKFRYSKANDEVFNGYQNNNVATTPKTEQVYGGYGHIEEPCKKVPKQHCKLVPKKVKKKVPKTKCRRVISKHCEDHPVETSKQECKDFPKEVCVEDPVSITKKIEQKSCKEVPKRICNKVPKQICEEIPEEVEKTTCKNTKPHQSSQEQNYGPANRNSSYPGDLTTESHDSYSTPGKPYGVDYSSFIKSKDDAKDHTKNDKESSSTNDDKEKTTADTSTATQRTSSSKFSVNKNK